MRYQRRHTACAKSLTGGGKVTTLEIAKSLLEVEAQSLEDPCEFQGRRSEEQALLQNRREKSLFKRQTQLEATQAKYQEFQLISFKNVTLREEQERELSPENEQKRQIERPLALTLCIYSVHRDGKPFVNRAILDRVLNAF